MHYHLIVIYHVNTLFRVQTVYKDFKFSSLLQLFLHTYQVKHKKGKFCFVKHFMLHGVQTIMISLSKYSKPEDKLTLTLEL